MIYYTLGQAVSSNPYIVKFQTCRNESYVCMMNEVDSIYLTP